MGAFGAKCARGAVGASRRCSQGVDALILQAPNGEEHCNQKWQHLTIHPREAETPQTEDPVFPFQGEV